MRQLGLEAAKKAEDAKTKARASAVKAFNSARETENKAKQETEGVRSENQAENVSPVQGEREELEGVGEGPDEEVDTDKGEGEVKDGEFEHSHGTLEPTVATTGQNEEAGGADRDTKGLEEHGGLEKAVGGKYDPREAKKGIDEGGSQSSEEPGTEVKRVTAATDEAEDLPGKKIKEQGAAVGDQVGDSVAD